jgi:hypothetical protein
VFVSGDDDDQPLAVEVRVREPSAGLAKRAAPSTPAAVAGEEAEGEAERSEQRSSAGSEAGSKAGSRELRAHGRCCGS